MTEYRRVVAQTKSSNGSSSHTIPYAREVSIETPKGQLRITFDNGTEGIRIWAERSITITPVIGNMVEIIPKTLSSEDAERKAVIDAWIEDIESAKNRTQPLSPEAKRLLLTMLERERIDDRRRLKLKAELAKRPKPTKARKRE